MVHGADHGVETSFELLVTLIRDLPETLGLGDKLWLNLWFAALDFMANAQCFDVGKARYVNC